MTILAMSKLRAIAPKNVRLPLMDELTKVGCVEVGNSAARLAEEEWAGVLQKFIDPSDAERRLSVLNSARELLDKYGAIKTSLLSPRRQVTEQEFQDKTIVDGACAAADVLNELGRQLSARISEAGRLVAKKASLMAWNNLDVPLDIKSGKRYKIVFGVSPTAGVPAQELVNEVTSMELAELALVSSDREQNYYLLLTHSSLHDEIMDKLKSKGFSVVNFKDVEGTASENIRQLELHQTEVENRRMEVIEKIKTMADQKDAIEHALDVFSIERERDQALSRLAGTQKTLLLEGWVPKVCEAQVAGILDSYGCAYQFDAPGEEDDDIPVLLQNNQYVTPFTTVTELYALPTYRSGLDPNPFMAPFFCIAFGIMTGDIMYGIMITLASWYLIKKMRPPEGSVLKRLLKLGFLCGLSGLVWGALFGGFLGNSIPAVSGAMLGREIALPPLLYDPMAEPMTLLIMALAFGFIQICFGLCLKGYKSIKQGLMFDAVCDAGFHLALLAGVALCLIDTNVGLSVMAIGALGIVCTGGRAASNIFTKLVGGLSSLYNCVNYLSDTLSYARLLGLGLATAVIAQVVNTLSTLAGPGFIGWIIFIPIFVFGHVFNLVINLLGVFVHSARLQFIEFYSKFYEPGGRHFAPLFNDTKYVEITIKEVV